MRRLYRHHEQFEKGATFHQWPLSISWIEDLQQNTFWPTSAQSLGSEVLRHPRIWGFHYERGYEYWDYELTNVLGPDYHEWIESSGNSVLDPVLPEIADSY
jgi:hypothetical protein